MDITHTTIILICISHIYCSTLSSVIPEAVKTATSVVITTINHSPKETRDELLEKGTLPSNNGLFTTFMAVAATTAITNKLFRLTHTYRFLHIAAARFTHSSTRLPHWAHKKILPALSLGASTLFSSLCFLVLQKPVDLLNKGITESLEELEQSKQNKK